LESFFGIIIWNHFLESFFEVMIRGDYLGLKYTYSIIVNGSKLATL
jgi:hypothetical protein